jgi:anion-transporting  ArsA/GET3 family ATPase
MAMQRLLSLQREGKYDLIILDTPPSRNTLALLDAPKLLARFFDERFIRWLVLPANKLVSAGMKKALGLLEKLTGGAFMTHLFEFAAALFEVRMQFSASLSKVTELLAANSTAFLLVAAPSRDTAPDALHFVQSVSEHGFHFEGILVNRRLEHLGLCPETPPAGAPQHLVHAFAVISALQQRESLAMVDLIENIRKSLDMRTDRTIPKCLSLPELARDVHSLSDLHEISLALERFNPA